MARCGLCGDDAADLVSMDSADRQAARHLCPSCLEDAGLIYIKTTGLLDEMHEVADTLRQAMILLKKNRGVD